MNKVIRYLVFIVGLLAISGFAFGGHSKSLCDLPQYYCIKAKSTDTWEKLWPNMRERDIVMRVNRINTRLYKGMTIAVPKALNGIGHMDISPLPFTIEPSVNSKIVIDIKKHAFGAYDRSGYLVYWGPVSGGKGWCSDVGRACNTPRGSFYVYTRGSENCVSTKFPIPRGGAPMPYCMFFFKGYAIHGGDLPGYHASHGCVRLFKEDAQWLNRNFVELGRLGTKVIVR